MKNSALPDTPTGIRAPISFTEERTPSRHRWLVLSPLVSNRLRQQVLSSMMRLKLMVVKHLSRLIGYTHPATSKLACNTEIPPSSTIF